MLVVCDRDADPYLKVRDWWNSDGKNYATPRQHLFELLGLGESTATNQFVQIGKGGVIWVPERPAELSSSPQGADQVVAAAQLAVKKARLTWRETNFLLLQRGPYCLSPPDWMNPLMASRTC